MSDCHCLARSCGDLAPDSQEFESLRTSENHCGDYTFRVEHVRCRACSRLYAVEADDTPAYRVIHNWTSE